MLKVSVVEWLCRHLLASNRLCSTVPSATRGQLVRSIVHRREQYRSSRVERRSGEDGDGLSSSSPSIVEYRLCHSARISDQIGTMLSFSGKYRTSSDALSRGCSLGFLYCRRGSVDTQNPIECRSGDVEIERCTEIVAPDCPRLDTSSICHLVQARDRQHDSIGESQEGLADIRTSIGHLQRVEHSTETSHLPHPL